MIDVSTLLGWGGKDLNKKLKALLTELQGLKFTLNAGAAAATNRAVVGLEDDCTVLFCLHNTAGVFADITDEVVINDRKAAGTVDITGVPVGTVVVNGLTYEFVVAAGDAVADPENTPVVKGATKLTAAAALAVAINARENQAQAPEVVATDTSSSDGQVTVTATARGTAGNAITLTESSTNLTVSAGTLAGGTATTGYVTSTDTSSDQEILVWLDKAGA